ncbi:MAG TPA: SDR family NAD(P)-dependent oxidoreductase [Deltaproteobacteria bacterium]|nr:SDR family NAD(P)-dependent oxidoreductase [Deltaproteobacteria bacterium]
MPGIKDFRGKVVVVTGAGSGIGRATAIAFAREGADLVIADVREERLDEVAKNISGLGARVMTKKTDVSKREEVEDLARVVLAERKRVDILFNNAGVGLGGSFAETSIEDFEWLFSINFWGVLYGIKAFLPHMMEKRYGHIVNTSSLAGLTALPGMSAYSAAKFAVAGLGEAIRSELRKYNIGVSTICPGVINTRVVEDGRMHLRESARANRDSVVEFYRRWGWPPERVAKAVLSAVRMNRSVVPVGPEAWVQWIGKRLSQTGFEALSRIAGSFLM